MMMPTWRCQKLVAAKMSATNLQAKEPSTGAGTIGVAADRRHAGLAGSGFGLAFRDKKVVIILFSPSRPRMGIFKTLGCASRAEPDGPVLPLRWIQGPGRKLTSFPVQPAEKIGLLCELNGPVARIEVGGGLVVVYGTHQWAKRPGNLDSICPDISAVLFFVFEEIISAVLIFPKK
jgi:hypothetical protein